MCSLNNNDPEASPATPRNSLIAVTSTSQVDEKPLIGAGKPFPPPVTNPEQYIVDFNGDNDPKNPFNWNFSVK
jgi:DHA1 family multidrug resistance protein-like MFS transporter